MFRLLALLFALFVLAAPIAGAQSLLNPPPVPTPTATATPANTNTDSGSTSPTLLYGAGVVTLLLFIGIGLLITKDARRSLPADHRRALDRSLHDEASHHKPKEAKDRARAKARAARAARKRNKRNR